MFLGIPADGRKGARSDDFMTTSGSRFGFIGFGYDGYDSSLHFSFQSLKFLWDKRGACERAIERRRLRCRKMI